MMNAKYLGDELQASDPNNDFLSTKLFDPIYDYYCLLGSKGKHWHFATHKVYQGSEVQNQLRSPNSYTFNTTDEPSFTIPIFYPKLTSQ